MKNRKGQTLEQPYLDIAMMRREQQEWREGMKVRYKKFEETQLLINAFDWEETPEKYDWWHEVYIGKTPDIPASSLAELEAWRKAKLIDYKTMYEDLLDKLEFYKKAFEGLKTTVEQNLHTAEWIDPLKVKEPDYKEMYEALKKEHEDIDKMYLELLEIHQKACAEHDRFSAETTERNYVWEAALAAMQGFIASYAGAAKNPDIDTVAGISLTYAESLVAEGKKRNHI